MANYDDVVARYIAMWNETDANARMRIVRETWTENAVYVDPVMRGDGQDGIHAMVGGVHQQFPGHKFRLIGKVDSHNDRVRFGWALAPDGGPDLIAGIDIGTVAPDGRLSSITGFIDQMPKAA